MKLDIMNDKKVLIDTSVWIKYFKDKPGTFSTRVDEVLSRHEVCVPKIVIAELIQGSRTEREISLIQDFVDAFSVIDQKEDSWVKAGRLLFNLRKKGKTIHLTDCYIAVIAQEHSCQICTLDEHFVDLAKVLHIGLLAMESA